MFIPYREGDDDFVLTYDGFSSQLMIDPETGHSRFSPMPPQEILDKFYNGTFTRSEDAPTPEGEFREDVINVFKEVRGYLHDIGAINQNNFTYHDVGCGFGASVWAMQQIGIKATGNETNRDWVERANPYCNNGLSANRLDDVLNNLGYKVDVFFCTHVLEHVPDPLWQLKQMSAHMSDDGVAYLVMPNANNFRSLIGGRRNDSLFEFPMHLNYFTPKSLTTMIREAGLEPVDGNTRCLQETDGQGRRPMDRLLRMPSNSAVDQDAWNEAQCKNWLGGELFMLAAKPGHKTIRRHADLDSLIERAFEFSRAAALVPRESELAQRQRLIGQEREVVRLNDLLDAVYKSRSWRITAPLRAFSTIANSILGSMRSGSESR